MEREELWSMQRSEREKPVVLRVLQERLMLARKIMSRLTGSANQENESVKGVKMRTKSRQLEKQHKKPGKSRHGVGVEDQANERRDDKYCKEGELRWRMGGSKGMR